MRRPSVTPFERTMDLGWTGAGLTGSGGSEWNGAVDGPSAPVTELLPRPGSMMGGGASGVVEMVVGIFVGAAKGSWSVIVWMVGGGVVR